MPLKFKFDADGFRKKAKAALIKKVQEEYDEKLRALPPSETGRPMTVKVTDGGEKLSVTLEGPEDLMPQAKALLGISDNPE